MQPKPPPPTIHVRASADLQHLIDRAVRVARQDIGEHLSRSEVIRSALTAGLEALVGGESGAEAAE